MPNSEQNIPPVDPNNILQTESEQLMHPVTAALELTKKTKRPVTLPGNGILASAFADNLGELLKDSGLFKSGSDIGTFRGVPVAFVPMENAAFRTFVEQFVEPVALLDGGKNSKAATMDQDDAAVTLASDQFKKHLPEVKKVLACQLPVFGEDGSIRLSERGYDSLTGYYTLPAPAPKMDISFEGAKALLDDYFSEFLFLEKEQGLPVSVAALFNVYCNGLLPPGALRPVFCVLANSEGSGKTMMVSAALVPTLGYAPAGVKPGHDDEMRKRLTSLVRAKKPVLFLDNIRNELNSSSIEAFTSSPVWEDRLLGVNTQITMEHDTSVYLTGNNLTLTPDLIRRSLIIELRLDSGKAEDRTFKRDLSDAVLQAMRPEILGALWSIVKRWEAAGKPSPSQTRAANFEWAKIVAGIVEFAGFGNCFQARKLGAPIDRDLDDMCRLARGIEARAIKLKTGDLILLARELGCFESILGIDVGRETVAETGNSFHEKGEKLDRSQSAKLGALLRRFTGRVFEDRLRFVAEGTGWARRYSVVDVAEGRNCCVDNPGIPETDPLDGELL